MPCILSVGSSPRKDGGPAHVSFSGGDGATSPGPRGWAGDSAGTWLGGRVAVCRKSWARILTCATGESSGFDLGPRTQLETPGHGARQERPASGRGQHPHWAAPWGGFNFSLAAPFPWSSAKCDSFRGFPVHVPVVQVQEAVCSSPTLVASGFKNKAGDVTGLPTSTEAQAGARLWAG